LPRKCPERSLVPTKTICSRCMKNQNLRPDDMDERRRNSITSSEGRPTSGGSA
jgi:hypothetical protein